MKLDQCKNERSHFQSNWKLQQAFFSVLEEKDPPKEFAKRKNGKITTLKA